MEVPKNLYFIAIIPPDEITDSVTKFKEDFANRFSSKTALKVMPHITLKAPFKLPVTEHDQLLIWFKKLFIPVKVFSIELNNFGAFKNPLKPVIFINPIMNTDLYRLQKEIIRSFKTSFPHIEIPDLELKFKPHMTVAYRDLDPEEFKKAWIEYKTKNFKAVFPVNDFHLLQHDTKRWNIIDTYSLSEIK